MYEWEKKSVNILELAAHHKRICRSILFGVDDDGNAKSRWYGSQECGMVRKRISEESGVEQILKKEEIFEYVKKQYGTVPEYLWSKLPDSAVLRHKNGKWYAVIMTVEKSKLGLGENDLVDIMDVKCDPEMTNIIIETNGFLPGYHMNKQHWITILLDGSVSEAKILDFLDISYKLIDRAGRKEEK